MPRRDGDLQRARRKPQQRAAVQAGRAAASSGRRAHASMVGRVSSSRPRSPARGSTTRSGADAGQAAEVARLAEALPARPAGQRAGIDDLGEPAAGRATAASARAASGRRAPRSASAWSPRRAAARCRPQCTPPRGRPARAAREIEVVSDGSAAAPTASRALPRMTARRRRASDGPDVRMMRRRRIAPDQRRRRRGKRSAGQRRKGLPALTCMTTSRSSAPMPAAAGGCVDAATAAGVLGHLDRVAAGVQPRCPAAPAGPTDSPPNAGQVGAAARRACTSSDARMA